MRQVTEVISTKRSAHRPFIRWFCANARRPIAFFNNVKPSLPPLLRQLERYRDGKGAPATDALDHVNELIAGDTDALVNFEGRIPSSVERWNDRFLRPRLTGNLRRVVVLRDPVNTLASLAKRCQPNDFKSLFKYFYQVLALEEIIAKLAQNRPAFCEKVVLMLPWLKDDLYRAEVARFFDLTPGAPPPQAHGALDQRWREAEDNPLFLAAFSDEHAAESARSFFGLFGAQETVDAKTVDALAQRAKANPAAADLVRSVLKPMRAARRQITAMEVAPQPAIRELWKGVVATRMMLRI